jgi:hypothetical protein
MGTTVIELKALPKFPGTDVKVEAFLKSTKDYQTLTKEQQEWFYWTNYSRKDTQRFWDSVVAPILQVYPHFRNSYSVSLQKDLYASPTLPLVAPNSQLEKIASDHADALARKKTPPSHTSPNGDSFQTRMGKIKKCAGENISLGPSSPVLALVLLYLDQGVPDVGHRKTLLSPSFTEMGIGISSYPNNKVMVVQDFACSQTL